MPRNNLKIIRNVVWEIDKKRKKHEASAIANEIRI